jgi:pyruvate-formate lyase
MEHIIYNVKHLSADEEIKVMEEFTETYKRFYSEHNAIREAMCLKVQFPAVLCRIQEGDLFAGRLEYLPIGFTPQYEGCGLGYYIDNLKVKKILSGNEASTEKKTKLMELAAFWEKEATHYKIRGAYPEKMKKALSSDDWQTDSGIAFPLYRLGGSILDFGKLLRLGIPGMLEEINYCINNCYREGSDAKLYEAMKIALDVLVNACSFYKNQALELSLNAENESWRNELVQMAEVLEKITSSKPKTLREAIQLVVLYWLISGSQNFGRMDTYLGDFYADDIDNGILCEEQALTLLEGMWRILVVRRKEYDTRIVIGGMGRKNEGRADCFALLAMEATRNVKEVTPQLALRFYKGMNPKLMEKALDVLSEGRTFPMLYNDDINVEAVMRAFDVSHEEALGYCPYGCGEYIIFHKSFGTPSGVINLLKALEITIYNGKDPVTGTNMGLSTGEFEEFDTFEKLFEAYCRQVEYHVEILAEQEELEYRIAGEEAAFLYFSMLYDDCMERGKAIFSGGIRYLGGTLETYGNTNTADSLTAIKELIYDKKTLSHNELINSLKANFEGYERERNLMLNAPKYGNDNYEADSIAVRVHEHVCNTTRKQRERTSLHNYLVVVINNNANTVLGRKTWASADGRKAGAFMANANNPAGGMDKSGITAMLNSLVKLDTSIHAGAVQNMKFSKEMFTKMRRQLEALLKTYFETGGSQAMITVLSREDLENALREPEKYANLIVRVGGFSARFIELEKDIQQDILSRTLY